MASFVRIVDCKSLSAAARAERLSLPAISRQLRALEQELGVSLIARSTRRLSVTQAGLSWYEHCVRILGDVEQARASVQDTQRVRGRLVVSAPMTFGSVVLVPQLSKLVETHPGLVVDLRLEDHLSDLVGEGVDVAIRAGSAPPDSTAVVARPLASMQRVLVASPAWLRKHGAPREPEELASQPCLVQVTPAGSVVRWSLCRGNATRSVDVRGVLRSNAPMALRDLALAGAGIAYLPDFLVVSELRSRRLRRVLPEWASAPIVAWAIHRAELRSAPRLRAFLTAIAAKSSPEALV